MRPRREQERRDSGQRVAGCENYLALPDVVAKPPAGVRTSRGEHIVQGVQNNGDAGGPREPVSWSQHARSIENEQRMREIARAKHADSEKKAPERSRQF